MTSFCARMCILGVSKTKFYILTPFSPKTEILGQFSTGLRKFWLKKALTIPGVSHVKKCDWLEKNITDWWLEVDLKKLNDWLMTYHNMTGGGDIMTSASEMHTRRIGLATRNQTALFMISINWYYVKCVLYSVDSTATCKSVTATLKTLATAVHLHGWCYIHPTVRTCTTGISNY